MRRLALFFIPYVILALFIGLRIADPATIQELRFKSFDFLQQTWPRPANADIPVYVVDIDEKSLKTLGQWPWPRTTLASLVDAMFEQQKVAAVGFDIIFSEYDRTSPQVIADNWQLDDGLKDSLSSLPNHDAVFAESLKNRMTVGGMGFMDSGFYQADTLKNLSKNRAPMNPKAGAATLGGEVANWIPRADLPVRMIPELENAVAGLGHVSLTPDRDNVVRSVPTFIDYNGQHYPTLTLEMLRIVQGAGSYVIRIDPMTGLQEIKVGQFTVPTGSNGQYWLRYRNHHFDKYISAVDVVNNAPTLPDMQGALVLLGTSAVGLKDLRSTPMAGGIPGVDVHAQMLETVLTEDFLYRPSWADGAEIIFLAITGLALILCVQYFGALASGVLTSLLTAGVVGTCIWIFRTHGFMLDMVYPLLTIVGGFMVHNSLKYAQEEAARKATRKLFSQYLSEDLIKRMLKSPDDIALGGEQREMTMLFSDIRGFTSMSENMEPQDLTRMLNTFLTPMTGTILDHQGTIDKYMGDAIMAFWNAPLDVPHHPQKACEAALSMRRHLHKLNAKWQDEGNPTVEVGIGLHTGMVSVGNMGSEQRFDYTVIGDAVNLASRLEGLSKLYGVQIVISDAVRANLPESAGILPLDLVAVKGKSEPVEIYALLEMDKNSLPEDTARDVELITKGIEAYRNQNWDEARACFVAVTQFVILKELYLKRIAAYKETPPPKDWSGVYTATSK